eukprot:SM000087S23388  [mRNA]  locus=s87:401416:402789:+ [translate_table: standard]
MAASAAQPPPLAATPPPRRQRPQPRAGCDSDNLGLAKRSAASAAPGRRLRPVRCFDDGGAAARAAPPRGLDAAAPLPTCGGAPQAAAQRSGDGAASTLPPPTAPCRLRGVAQWIVLEAVPKAARWTSLGLSVPFAVYSAVYLWGDLDLIRPLTPSGVAGDMELAGRNVANNLLLWQIHSGASLAFLATGALQFSPWLRRSRISWHRASGRLFLAAAAVLALSGSTRMAEQSDLSPVGTVAAHFMGPYFLFSLARAYMAIRRGDVQRHREWMIRAASFGYAVIHTRYMAYFVKAMYDVPFPWATGMALWLCQVASVALAELYIQLRYHGLAGLVPPVWKQPVRPHEELDL